MLPGSAEWAAVINPGSRGDLICGENKAWQGSAQLERKLRTALLTAEGKAAEGSWQCRGVSQTQGASHEGQGGEPRVFV